MVTLTFKCPDCQTKLAPVEAAQIATQVVKRTCRNKECGRRWQLVVQPLVIRDGMRLDKATFVGVSPGVQKEVR